MHIPVTWPQKLQFCGIFQEMVFVINTSNVSYVTYTEARCFIHVCTYIHTYSMVPYIHTTYKHRIQMFLAYLVFESFCSDLPLQQSSYPMHQRCNLEWRGMRWTEHRLPLKYTAVTQVKLTIAMQESRPSFFDYLLFQKKPGI